MPKNPWDTYSSEATKKIKRFKPGQAPTMTASKPKGIQADIDEQVKALKKRNKALADRYGEKPTLKDMMK